MNKTLKFIYIIYVDPRGLEPRWPDFQSGAYTMSAKDP